MRLFSAHKGCGPRFFRSPSPPFGFRQKKEGRSAGTKREWRDARKKGVLICRKCGCMITKVSERIAVNGSVAHTFANPAGIVFEIECFKNAPGCLVSTSASEEFTWFPGYAWQIAHCTTCLTHMGWRFISEGGYTFFALIADRLTDAPQTDP